MQDHVAVIHDQPAITGLAFLAAFLLMLFAHALQNGIGQRIEHAVAGTVADDEIICKTGDVFEIEQ